MVVSLGQALRHLSHDDCIRGTSPVARAIASATQEWSAGAHGGRVLCHEPNHADRRRGFGALQWRLRRSASHPDWWLLPCWRRLKRRPCDPAGRAAERARSAGRLRASVCGRFPPTAAARLPSRSMAPAVRERKRRSSVSTPAPGDLCVGRQRLASSRWPAVASFVRSGHVGVVISMLASCRRRAPGSVHAEPGVMLRSALSPGLAEPPRL
jgi:hypothetical protein